LRQVSPVSSRSSGGGSGRREVRWRTRGLIRSYWDIWIVAAAVVVANLRLPAGGSTDNLALVPAKVAAGEWWRLLTHPFAHITVYHLLLDGVPFFLLYPFLDEKRPAGG